MYFTKRFLVLAVAILPSVVAVVPPEPVGCANGPATEEELNFARENYKEFLATANQEAAGPREKILIPMYIHIVAKKSSGDGLTDEKRIKGQVQALNEVFGKADINFDLKGFFTHRDDNLYANAEFKELAQFRKEADDYSVLNLYVTGNAKYNGVAYLPMKNPPKSHIPIDAAIITHKTFWGGKERPRGTTAIHEIGHWLSLPHTFDGGCDGGKGDGISDTPAHQQPTVANKGYNCKGDASQLPNTCPNLPGNDPINNYMNYTDEPCRTEFSPAQYAQMRKAWLELRKPLAKKSATPAKPATTVKGGNAPKPATTSASSSAPSATSAAPSTVSPATSGPASTVSPAPTSKPATTTTTLPGATKATSKPASGTKKPKARKVVLTITLNVKGNKATIAMPTKKPAGKPASKPASSGAPKPSGPASSKPAAANPSATVSAVPSATSVAGTPAASSSAAASSPAV